MEEMKIVMMAMITIPMIVFQTVQLLLVEISLYGQDRKTAMMVMTTTMIAVLKVVFTPIVKMGIYGLLMVTRNVMTMTLIGQMTVSKIVKLLNAEMVSPIKLMKIVTIII